MLIVWVLINHKHTHECTFGEKIARASVSISAKDIYHDVQMNINKIEFTQK